jgi:hypothetical protein
MSEYKSDTQEMSESLERRIHSRLNFQAVGAYAALISAIAAAIAAILKNEPEEAARPDEEHRTA